jgi:hypothetical protein
LIDASQVRAKLMNLADLVPGGEPHVDGNLGAPGLRAGPVRPFRPGCPDGTASQAMIMLIPQLISCGINMIMKNLFDRGVPSPQVPPQPAHRPHGHHPPPEPAAPADVR